MISYPYNSSRFSKVARLTLGLILFSLCAHAQYENYLHSEYHYQTANNTIAPGWQQVDFDDSNWSRGTGSIGYGDYIFKPHFSELISPYISQLYLPGDTLINTLVDTSTAIYLRYTFSLDNMDTTGLSGLSLNMYFDDGFIAYYNGIEFARVNMGSRSDTAYPYTLTTRSHESQFQAGDPYPVPGYFISKALLFDHLNPEKNIIAIELHNDSTKGSDLFLECFLERCLSDTVYDPVRSLYSDLTWVDYSSRSKAYSEPDSVNLPLVLIETNEFGIPFAHVEVPAHMKIINQKGLNHHADTSFEYNNRIKIEVRGNSTSYFPKRPFNIETQFPDGSNNNVSLMGLPEENDWVLNAPFTDRSFIRHTLSYELGRKQGYWEPRTKYCELMLNGEYLGLYALTEKIKPDKNRLAIAKLKETDLYGDDVSGGYIFWKEQGFKLQIYYPKETKIQAEQTTYLENFVNRFWEQLYSNNWLDPDQGYRNYIDTESMLDYLIINELAFDHDKYSSSTYAYKDRNDKDSLIHFGPLWDYNYAYGNTDQSFSTDRWRFNIRNSHFKRYFQDTAMVRRFAEKWFEQRQRFLHTDSIFALIDSLTHHFEEARQRDSIVWQAYNTVNIYFANDTVFEYTKTIQNLKNWIIKRAEWIDENIELIYYPLVTYPEHIENMQVVQSMSVFPNPVTDYIQGEITLLKPAVIQLQLTDMNGTVCGFHHIDQTNETQLEFYWKLPQNLLPGNYLLHAYSKGNPMGYTLITKE